MIAGTPLPAVHAPAGWFALAFGGIGGHAFGGGTVGIVVVVVLVGLRMYMRARGGGRGPRGRGGPWF